MKTNHARISILLFAALLLPILASADDAPQAMFGYTPSHNMVSGETGLPTQWDPKTGANIKWTAELGSQTYAGPVVLDGKVYVGSNNQREYNPKLKGDRGNVMAFDATTGKLIWQSAHAKLGAGRVNDWPLQGVCSTPFVDGDRVYYVSNRAEVVCADTEGFRDGENDGPFTDEAEKSEIAGDWESAIDHFSALARMFPDNPEYALSLAKAFVSSGQPDKGYSAAEALRRRIHDHSFPGGESQPAGRVTMSIGVSTFPDDADTEDALIAAADQAVYAAKKAGRDTVR